LGGKLELLGLPLSATENNAKGKSNDA
jgi:hypothetical protein